MTEPAVVNASALLNEAATKSGIVWVVIPGDRPWAVWHAYADGKVVVVSGPGEQTLPEVPGEVELVFRSKDNGGRLIRVAARAVTLQPESPEWEAAVATLMPVRLNSPGDVDLRARWARECMVRTFEPFGAPLESPGSLEAGDGRVIVQPSPASTGSWHPWHIHGRPQLRLRLRRRSRG